MNFEAFFTKVNKILNLKKRLSKPRIFKFVQR